MTIALGAGTRDKARTRDDGVILVDLPFSASGEHEAEFSRADLVFTGVDHSGPSYEVRVFMNNPEADGSTARTAENGYAGRFVVFGHGGCFGDEGHCEVDATAPAVGAPAFAVRPHPLTPQSKALTVTRALRQVLAGDAGALTMLTLVPVLKAAVREDCRVEPGIFSYHRVSLQTYR